MKDKDFDALYRNVPQTQREQLKQFRSTHPYKTITVNGVTWEYISCGKGEESLVLLPGGSFRFGETWFHLITAFENEYRIISPTYPDVPTMAERVRGISRILEAESIGNAHVLGWSLGGWTAQCFVRSHPEKVKTLILTNTSGPKGMSKRLARIGVFFMSAYPLWFIRFGLKKRLLSFLSPDAEHQFWNAFIEEILLKTAKKDLVIERKCIYDYVMNYHFSKDDLGDWPGRVLIIESDNDSAFDEPAREDLKRLYPRAQVHTFHRAEHAPMYNKPAEFTSVVRTFLKE